jgi:hypothetical protein
VDHINLVFGRLDQIVSGTSIELKKSIIINYIKNHSNLQDIKKFPKLLFSAVLTGHHKGLPVKNYLRVWN